MSRAKIDVVCESHEAFRRRDLEAFVECMDPEVEFTSLVLEVEGSYRGHEGIRAWWNDILAVFPEWQPQVEDAREVSGRVVLRVRAEGAGTGSGIDLDRAIWQVAEVHDGRLTSWKFFRTEQEALAAAAARPS
jgi:ketosteroid isomerase-like protein